MANTTLIDETRFAELTSPLVGVSISRAWLGDYTALYLEIGPLIAAYPNSGRPEAQHTAYLGFHWVLESEAEQELSSTDAGAAARIESSLTGDQIAAVNISQPSELVLALASKRRLRSVASERGEPEWTIYLPSGSCIAVQARSLVLESRAA